MKHNYTYPLCTDTLVEHIIRSINGSVLMIAITGSQAIGLANSQSDIDVIVVLQNYDHDIKPSYQSWMVDGKAVEALILTSKMAREICDAIDERDYRDLSADTRDLILKFLYAIPIYHESYFKALMDGRDVESTILKWVAIQRHYAGKNFNDIIIAKRDGDYLLAIEAYRNLLRNEVDALLCLYGDVYSRSKRQAQRVKRTPELSGDFYQKYLTYCYHLNLTDLSFIDRWLDDALRFHNYLQYLILSKMFDLEAPIPGITHVDTKQVYSCTSLFIIPMNNYEWLVKSNNYNCAVTFEVALVLLLTHSPVDLISLQRRLSNVFDGVESFEITITHLINNGLLNYFAKD